MADGNEKNDFQLESESLVNGETVLIVRNAGNRGAKPCRQSDFDQLYLYNKPKKPGFRERVARKSKGCDVKGSLLSLFPVTDWLFHYQWKSDILCDLTSGATVAVMHIPHGIAYSMLAGVPPVVGIYMAFFPVLVYLLMGTSRHLSIGTLSVVCIMASKAVLMYSEPEELSAISNSSSIPIEMSENRTYLSPMQVGAAVCFVVGFWQVVMGVLKLGVLSVLLSETLVSGFTTGVAIHVITSQINKFFGLKLPRRTGPLKIIFVYYDLFVHITDANLVAVAISVVTILCLSVWNELVKPRVEKKIPIPVPIELIAVIIGTVVSYLAGFEELYNVKTIGQVSTGLPVPEFPPLWLFPKLVVDGLVISIVAFSINISMAKILARKGNYSVSANQELLAAGCANLVGSLFGCVPTAASLSRSMIQLKVGGKTQLASFFSCFILLFVLLFAGPLFQPLPNCVLASIVVVTLKGMIMQVKDLFQAWRHSHADALVWLGSFLGVVVLDLDYGLCLGVSFSLLTLVIRGQKPLLRTLGNVPGSQIYLDVKCYHSAVEIPGVRIVQVAGGLHFANKDYLLHKIQNLSEGSRHEKINPDKQDSKSPPTYIQTQVKSKPLCLILDMVSVSFVDPSAVKALLSLHKDIKNQGRILCLTNCSWTVFESFNKCGFFEDFPESYLFSSVHDAVAFISRHSVML